MRYPLSDHGLDSDFERELATFSRSAWRFEQQPTYDVGYEREMFDDFVAGRPRPATDSPDLRDWLRLVRRQTDAGKTVERVRVVDAPPTDYQLWVMWLQPWNVRAGERLRSLSRRALDDVALPQWSLKTDWWLFDNSRLMLMHFDGDPGVRTGVEMLVGEPEVLDALVLRDDLIRAARRAADPLPS